MLLYGVLEEAHDITGDVVDATAVELAQDLEGMQLEPMGMAMPAARADASAAAPGANSYADLLNRIEALEHQMTEREQVFRRLTQMLGV